MTVPTSGLEVNSPGGVNIIIPQENTQKQENITSKPLLGDVEISIKWSDGTSLNKRSRFPTGFPRELH